MGSWPAFSRGFLAHHLVHQPHEADAVKRCGAQRYFLAALVSGESKQQRQNQFILARGSAKVCQSLPFSAKVCQSLPFSAKVCHLPSYPVALRRSVPLRLGKSDWPKGGGAADGVMRGGGACKIRGSPERVIGGSASRPSKECRRDACTTSPETQGGRGAATK